MAEAGYEIERDPANRLIRITLHGFWDDATMRDYRSSLLKLAASAPPRKPADRARILVDLRDHVVLSRDHAATMQAMLETIGGGYRTAVLVAQMGLLKKQVERVGSALRPMVFTSEEEALDWLLAGPTAGTDRAAA